VPGVEETSREYDRIVFAPEYFQTSFAALALLLPAAPLLAGVRWRRLSDLDRVMALVLALTCATMYLVPFAHVLKFHHAPRYWLSWLPAAAFLLDRLDFRRPGRGQVAAAILAAAAGIAIVATAGSGPNAAGTLVMACSPLAFVAACRIGPVAGRVTALGVAVAVVAVTLGVSPDARGYLGTRTHPGPDQQAVASWIEQHRARIPPGHLFTNSMMLDQILDDRGLESVRPVRYLVQHDIHYEIFHLTNHANGQYRAILRALAPLLYGHAVWACEMAGNRDRSQDVFVLDDDYRLWQVYPQAFWDAISTPVARFGKFAIRQGRPAGPEDPPLDLSDEVLSGPCGG
jgi:hypothetical protein